MQETKIVDGLFVRYWGSLESPRTPVLLTHGVSGTSWDWVRAVMQVPSVDTCYAAVDLPGFGQSEAMPGQDYSLTAMASRIADTAEQLFSGRRYTYVAHSFAGKLGILLAGRHPVPLAGLALIDIGTELGPGTDRVQERVREWPREFATLGAAMAQYRSLYPKESVDVFRLRMNEYLQSSQDGSIRIRRDLAFDEAFLQADRELESEMLWRAWKSIAVPTRIVRAGNSNMLLAETVTLMQEAQPATTTRIIEDSGHNVLSERPEAVLNELRWAAQPE